MIENILKILISIPLIVILWIVLMILVFLIFPFLYVLSGLCLLWLLVELAYEFVKDIHIFKIKRINQ